MKTENQHFWPADRKSSHSVSWPSINATYFGQYGHICIHFNSNASMPFKWCVKVIQCVVLATTRKTRLLKRKMLDEVLLRKIKICTKQLSQFVVASKPNQNIIFPSQRNMYIWFESMNVISLKPQEFCITYVLSQEGLLAY